jgi:hypothetical protein
MLKVESCHVWKAIEATPVISNNQLHSYALNTFAFFVTLYSAALYTRVLRCFTVFLSTLTHIAYFFKTMCYKLYYLCRCFIPFEFRLSRERAKYYVIIDQAYKPPLIKHLLFSDSGLLPRPTSSSCGPDGTGNAAAAGSDKNCHNRVWIRAAGRRLGLSHRLLAA